MAYKKDIAPVAQWTRVLRFERRSRGFESHQVLTVAPERSDERAVATAVAPVA